MEQKKVSIYVSPRLKRLIVYSVFIEQKSANGQPSAPTPDRATTGGKSGKKSGRPRTNLENEENSKEEGTSPIY